MGNSGSNSHSSSSSSSRSSGYPGQSSQRATQGAQSVSQPPPRRTTGHSRGVHPGTRANRQPGSYSTGGGRQPSANGARPGQNQLYDVVIPPGVSGGQTFQVEINHARVNVQCPPGMRAGQSLRITLPRNHNSSNQNRQAYMVTIPAGVRPREQFRVMVNGQELMVTCPDNARPGTNVRIYPPTPTNRNQGRLNRPQIQTFEVQVPAGVQPGQPFALIANGQRVLVTCPATAGPGQRIRFQLPVHGSGGGKGDVSVNAVKLSYDKDGWSRCIDPGDMKFHWVLNTSSEESKTADTDEFDAQNYAIVRKINFSGVGTVPGQQENVMAHSVEFSMHMAEEVPTDARVERPPHDEAQGALYDHSDLAKVHGQKFSEKLSWFREACLALRTPWEEEHTFIFVRRQYLMDDSIKGIMALDASQLRNMFRFEFIGEPGIDAGGVAREWFQLVAEQLFHPDFGLWQYSAVNQMCMQINASSGVANGDHLRYYRFTGRVLGKALFDGQLIPSHMIRHLYKHLLGWPLMFDDIEMIDSSVYRSLQQVLEYAKGGADVEDLCLDFTVTEEMLGESKVIPLVKGGEDMDVTNDNLKLFMESRLKYQVLDRVKDQLKELLIGFYEVVPEALLIVFDFQELELVMCGLPEIKMEDWKEHTEYLGSYESKKQNHQVCQWFWEVVDEYSEELRARLLQFVTGTSGVPASGFSHLQGNDGNIRLFCINSISLGTSLFPRAHTCFNRIDLPLYTSKQQLKDKLTLAVQLEA
eukprot:CAMPEP_0118638432 /NCGR_PEP_ID=MMETSP0785-20121206/3680_1 /TAXON_ID=91992 /ORGANISM="Bolidomonas pacifica, Strain CCMP 1866" /LENGTH=753 /DNA_ID=CAMNT_0006529679 /DNA_START=80 /DNA_END=2338 /DNA_ORIENTATION=+